MTADGDLGRLRRPRPDPHADHPQPPRPARPRRRQVRHPGRALRRRRSRWSKDGQSVPARSIMGLMMLGAGPGCRHRTARRGVGRQGGPGRPGRPDRVRLRRAGLSRWSALPTTPSRPPRRPRPAPRGRRPERRLVGIPVSAGIAIGPVFGAAEPHGAGGAQARSMPPTSPPQTSPAGRGDPAVPQAVAEAPGPARRAAGGQPGRDRAR